MPRSASFMPSNCARSSGVNPSSSTSPGGARFSPSSTSPILSACNVAIALSLGLLLFHKLRYPMPCHSIHRSLDRPRTADHRYPPQWPPLVLKRTSQFHLEPVEPRNHKIPHHALVPLAANRWHRNSLVDLHIVPPHDTEQQRMEILLRLSQHRMPGGYHHSHLSMLSRVKRTDPTWYTSRSSGNGS